MERWRATTVLAMTGRGIYLNVSGTAFWRLIVVCSDLAATRFIRKGWWEFDLLPPFHGGGIVRCWLLRGLTNGVYSRVDFLTTIGLSAKKAYTIVEFAKG